MNVYQPADPAHAKNPLQDAVITALAEKHRKTPAQVILRWHLDHGFSGIPKSVRAERIRENYQVSGFTLEPAEITRIDDLDTGTRAGSDPEKFGPDSYQVDVDRQ